MDELPSEWVDEFNRNQWTNWIGTGGRFASESVAELARNTQAWAQIVTKDTPEDYQKCLNVHMHSRSFIDWDMGDGQYVCKYLEKQEQKFVPVSFENVGRFWGASRGLVPKPSVIVAREMSLALVGVAPKAVKQAVRWLSKWHEKHTGGNSYARHSWNSQSIPTGAPVLKQIMRYFMQLDYPDEHTESPF